MKENRNIDELFEERFKNFEAKPSPRVWENIQAELHKKKDRKVIPLWIKLGSVAALLALLLTVGNWVFNPLNNNDNPYITQEDVINTQKESNASENAIFEKETNNLNSQVASEDIKTDNEEVNNQNASKNTSIKTEDKTISSDKKANRTTVAVENSKENSSNKQSNRQSNRHSIASQDANKSSAEKDKTSKENLIPENVVPIKANRNTANETRVSSNVSSEKNSNSLKESNGIISKNDNSTSETKNNAIVSNEKPSGKVDNDLPALEAEKPVETKNEKSILDAIAEQNDAVATKTKDQKPENRWEVAPNVAPVYYSSLGNGSSIDPSFSDNTQSGDVNISYGVQVSYALNNRLSVRTGVNNVDLSYSTGGIELATAPVSSALRSVDYGARGTVVTAVNKGTFAQGAQTNEFGDLKLKSTQGDARIIQNINYYEVPLELKYAILDRKFGVNIIGGVSTLFLGSNEISVKADNFSSVLGDANNLSTVSFSTNVGLGLDYKLSKRFKFNIEPMFKYQLNPYTDSSVNFKPYYLGVYSGISFKF